jgi:Family of unknown function (DUF6101)
MPGINRAAELALRRQSGFGGIAPAGSSRDERLDPFRLPVRFAVAGVPADAVTRIVDLSRKHVVLHRIVRGMKVAIRLRVSSYLGIVLRIDPAVTPKGAVEIALEHRDPALSLPLSHAENGWDAVADWQSWSRVLGLPLLLAESDGTLREAVARVGALRVDRPTWRRRRRCPISRRRPSILLRRTPGPRTGTA